MVRRQLFCVPVEAFNVKSELESFGSGTYRRIARYVI